LLASGAHANGASVKFQHTGATVEWIVPNGITNVTFEALGASGGSIVNQWGGYLFYGGLGGRVQGNLAVAPGQTLFITVGGLGQNGYSMGAGGGFNGGAPGGAYGGGGGGATDIRVGGVSLSSRVVIAGGGGGAANSAIALGDYSGGRNGNGGGTGPLTSSLGTGTGGLYSGGGGGHYGGTSGGPSTHAGGGSSYVDPSQTSEVLVENGISGTPQLHSRPGELLISYADDTTPPVITLNGSSPQTVYRGTAFTDLGATVTDDFDATRTITGSGTVDATTVGSYTLTYSAQDEVGNAATPVTRTVEVVLDPNGDEDNDGLNNTEEANLGTNPYLRDTDGDGVNDLREVGDATDPLDPTSFDPLNLGLVAYYPFNGDAEDKSGFGYHGVNNGGVFVSNRVGLTQKAIAFDGTFGRCVYVPESEDLLQSATSFAISCWLRLDGFLPSNNMQVVGRWGLADILATSIDGGVGKLFFQKHGSPNIRNGVRFDAGAEFVHLALVWNGAVIDVFLNGKKVQAVVDADFGFISPRALEIGGNLGSGQTIIGAIDDVRLYGRALNAGEVASLFASEKYSGAGLEGAATKSPFDPATAVNWNAGGATWTVDTSVTHDGVDSVKAQTTDGQSTYREYTVTGPAVVDFWWKVSSEKNYDKFSYSLNGVNQETISGEVDWAYRTLTLPAGSHTIRWTYSKDESGAVGQDAGWLDDFVVYPATATLQVRDGSTVVSGTATVDFGSADVGSAGFTKSLTFVNEGYVPLEVQLALQDGSPFTFDDVSNFYRLFLGRGESLDVPIVLSTQGAGTRSAQLTVLAPDSTIAPPAITLTGYVRGPDIGVAQGAASLTSGQTFDVGLTPRTVEFTIRNNANVGDLVISAISATGNFQISQQPAMTIPPQGSTTFKVLAQNVTSGVQTGSVSITSNAGNLATFSLPLTSKSLTSVTEGIADGSMATSGTGGATAWDFAATTLPSGQSGQALKTGSTPNNGGSVLEFTTQTAGVVSWSWKVSTQEDFDWLLCEVDGQEAAGISTKNDVWQTQVVNVPAGATVRWVYRKDGSGNIGEDAGYLADLEFRSLAANQSFNQWAQTHGIYDPQQRMPKSGLQAMFGWLGGFGADEVSPYSNNCPFAKIGSQFKGVVELGYRFLISKTADGTQQILYSSDMGTWTTRRISQRIVGEDADRLVIEATALSGTKGFFKVVGGGDTSGIMVRVQGGTLPQSSGLAGTAVSTFQIGRTEVTWDEWQEVRAWAVGNGYTDLAGVGAGSSGNHPVTDVSWYDVVKWCNAKSEKQGLTPVYRVGAAVYRSGQSTPTVDFFAIGFRLPSEAEWEWAARGGVNSQGYTYSGSNEASAVAWYVDNSAGNTKEVETKEANELAIHDMSGNVWEWCEATEFQASSSTAYGFVVYYTDGGKAFSFGTVLADPMPPQFSVYGMTQSQWNSLMSGQLQWDEIRRTLIPSPSHRRIRGASWGDGETYCAVANSDYAHDPASRHGGIGFRLARNAED